MKRLLASVALLAAISTPALAAGNHADRLTLSGAKASVRAQARATIGTLLYRSIGTAPVKVSGCRVKGQQGTCNVVVSGTSRCQYVAHVHRIVGGDMTWGEGLRCS